MIIAAADGSSLSNPGPSGWAWFIDKENWASGGWSHSTNNRAELTAVLDLLHATLPASDEPLHILCDSQYVINSLTKWMPGWKRRGWKRSNNQPVLNPDILSELDHAMAGRALSFEWVKGHAGHQLNEIVDTLARDTATAFSRGEDPGRRGPGFVGTNR